MIWILLLAILTYPDPSHPIQLRWERNDLVITYSQPAPDRCLALLSATEPRVDLPGGCNVSAYRITPGDLPNGRMPRPGDLISVLDPTDTVITGLRIPQHTTAYLPLVIR